MALAGLRHDHVTLPGLVRLPIDAEAEASRADDEALLEPGMRTATVAPFLDHLDALRYDYLLAITTQLASEGRLRTGLTPARAADLAMAMTGPGTHEELVRGRGWQRSQATSEVADVLVASLVARDAPAATVVDWAALGVQVDPFGDAGGLPE